MKKITALGLCFCVIINFCACYSNPDPIGLMEDKKAFDCDSASFASVYNRYANRNKSKKLSDHFKYDNYYRFASGVSINLYTNQYNDPYCIVISNNSKQVDFEPEVKTVIMSIGQMDFYTEILTELEFYQENSSSTGIVFVLDDLEYFYGHNDSYTNFAISYNKHPETRRAKYYDKTLDDFLSI